MASYGALIRSITTAEINRVQREGGYTRWVYFIDEDAGKAGVLFANNNVFTAYTVADEPDPKLTEFGLEPIPELVLTPDPQLLLLTAGDNELRATVFKDPASIIDDDFVPSFDYAVALEWQRYLRGCGMQLAEDPRHRQMASWTIAGIAVLVLIFMGIALFG